MIRIFIVIMALFVSSQSTNAKETEKKWKEHFRFACQQPGFSPIGTYKGSLKDIKAHQLGSLVISDLLKRSKINSEEIDEIIFCLLYTSDAADE